MLDDSRPGCGQQVGASGQVFRLISSSPLVEAGQGSRHVWLAMFRSAVAVRNARELNYPALGIVPEFRSG